MKISTFIAPLRKEANRLLQDTCSVYRPIIEEDEDTGAQKHTRTLVAIDIPCRIDYQSSYVRDYAYKSDVLSYKDPAIFFLKHDANVQLEDVLVHDGVEYIIVVLPYKGFSINVNTLAITERLAS